MPFRRSRRSDTQVIFHCPACFADRVGAVRRGRWRAWPDDRPDVGDYIVCSGCHNQIHPCNVVNSVTATAFSTRLFCGVRSLMASVVSVDPAGDELYAEAVEAVRSFSSLPYSRERLVEDLAAHDLGSRLRGDLILLAEQLEPRAADVLLDRAAGLAAMHGAATEAQRTVLAEAASFLGRPGSDALRSTA